MGQSYISALVQETLGLIQGIGLSAVRSASAKERRQSGCSESSETRTGRALELPPEGGRGPRAPSGSPWAATLYARGSRPEAGPEPQSGLQKFTATMGWAQFSRLYF